MAHTARTPLVLPALALTLLAGGCGNAVTADVVGLTGMTVDQQGRPVIVVAVCEQDVDTIEIVGGREGLEPDEPNATLASWSASSPQSGSFRLAVGAAAAPWVGTESVQFADDRLYIASASRSDADVETTQVSFRGRALDGLDDGRVIVRDGRVWSRAKFDDQACDA